MFKKVLIANRGAIAVRIERTLARMGVASVAVYSDADVDSLHVENADESVSLGSGAASETYLDADKIIAAAKGAGAKAVHPGYGFLSENASFARACAANGIAFIGPTPEQIESFGLKHVARSIAERCGVPLLPGTGILSDLDEALDAARRIGYPVMLKSTAGGGGIGMRVCRTEDELVASFDEVRHLAGKNFNDADVFLEKYVTHARHIEVQIFGDGVDAVAIAERDCSVQRRNQKVVEETPAPNLSAGTRTRMLAAAERMAKDVGYRSAGTVEFLYDEKEDAFYFLEVNTRLQVEHGITEECTGIDLVEWMVREAAGELSDLRSAVPASRGASIEARVYAEDPSRGFVPTTGIVDDARFDSGARIETWIRKGVEVTSLYDPMLAKIIVHADNRAAAVALMKKTLANSRIYGVATNLRYLEALFGREDYAAGALSTHMLDDFTPDEPSIEVIKGGVQTTVQDYPGFTGHWAVGIPPCGPMDPLSFRLGNAALGNDEDAAGLEFTIEGGSYRFRTDARIILTGASMPASIDDLPIEFWQTVSVHRGQVLSLGSCEKGMRSYLCVEGGLDIPSTLGSASTFVNGRIGGHNGRALRPGDVLQLKGGRRRSNPAPESGNVSLECRPVITTSWEIGLIPGPQPTKEFLKPSCLDELCSSDFGVNYDSARTGVRLDGPVPPWSRADGGEAGLHPSNVHDNAYAIGALDLTGDQIVILGSDGPSLGGFVCPATVAIADRWKVGQLRPGDTVRFRLLSLKQAGEARRMQECTIESVRVRALFDEPANAAPHTRPLPNEPSGIAGDFDPQSVILHESGCGDDAFCIRQAAEDALLVEYGPMKLDVALRLRVHLLMNALLKTNLPVEDLTPGARSLQVHFDPDAVSMEKMRDAVVAANEGLPDLAEAEIPSRLVRLPLSWNDPQIQLAARRYQETTRPNAPWCPSNIEFIRRINGLRSIDDVRDIIFDARYLVVGLGDVYLGAPVAIPLDPRHQLVTTKYNPARPWTPENAVGIGGAYLGVYGMEGPGGYQLVGRTVQTWNRFQPTGSFLDGKPWLLRFFDQVQFYPVTTEELARIRRGFPRGRYQVEIEESTFNLVAYEEFLRENADSIARFKSMRQEAFDAEHQRWVEQGLDTFESESAHETLRKEGRVPDSCIAVVSTVSGAVWKALAEKGAYVSKGDAIMVVESMKMEFEIAADETGTIEEMYASPGDLVDCGQTVAAIRLNE